MKKVAIFFLMSFFASIAVHAASPTNMNLSYDLTEGTLTVEGGHPTQDRFEHFIRRIEVTSNNKEPQLFYFTRQNSPSQFKETITFDMKPGDQIHVQAYCSYGGSIAGDVQIPEEKKPAVINLKELRDKDHKNTMVIP